MAGSEVAVGFFGTAKPASGSVTEHGLGPVAGCVLGTVAECEPACVVLLKFCKLFEQKRLF